MPKNIPTIGSDQWAEWITQELLRPGGELTDAYIAQLVDTPDSAARLALERLVEGGYAGAVSTAIQHTDDAVSALQTALLAAISQSAVAATANANQYADVQDRKVLADAQAYTDAHTGTGGVSQTYVDTQDGLVSQGAKNYADTVSRETLESAQDYTNNAATSTLSQAKAYTDAHSGTGDGATQAYVDTADAATLRSANDYANEIGRVANDRAEDADDVVSQTAREYADGKATETLNTARTTATQLADDARAASQAYADEQDEALADGLSLVVDNKVAGILADANTYTDGKVSGLTTKTYVDGQFSTKAEAFMLSDVPVNAIPVKSATGTKASLSYSYAPTVSTLVIRNVGGVVAVGTPTDNTHAATKLYTDSQDASTLAAAKAYTDGFTGASDTGWVAIPVNSGFTTYTSVVFYRIRNGFVQLRGSLSSSAAIASVAAVLTLPAAARPSTAQAYLGIGTATSVFRITVNTNGTINVDPTSGNTGTVVWFSQISYLLG